MLAYRVLLSYLVLVCKACGDLFHGLYEFPVLLLKADLPLPMSLLRNQLYRPCIGNIGGVVRAIKSWPDQLRTTPDIWLEFLDQAPGITLSAVEVRRRVAARTPTEEIRASATGKCIIAGTAKEDI